MTDIERIKSILAEIEYGYISYDNMHGDDGHGLKLIEEALEKKQSYTKGIVDEHNRIVRIIEDMKETAEANMMFRHADACECILKAIEEVEND